MTENIDCPISQALVKNCLQSLENTFSSMVMMDITAGAHQHKKNGNPLGCISGSIGISGTHTPSGKELRAQLSLIFPEPLAHKIFRRMMMMGDEDPVQQEEVNDVVGELSNMAAGGAKTLMSEKDFQLSISLPTIAVGHDHYLSTPSGSTLSIVIPVHIQEESFFVEISATVK